MPVRCAEPLGQTCMRAAGARSRQVSVDPRCKGGNRGLLVPCNLRRRCNIHSTASPVSCGVQAGANSIE